MKSAMGPGRVETFFVSYATGRAMGLDATVFAYFCCIGSGVNLGAALSEMNGHKARTTRHSSCPDRREERFDTDDIHHA
jgi:hypothetical protein